MVASWIILIVAIAITVIVGFYYTKKMEDDADFLVAGRSLGPVACACTLCATYWSGYAFLGSVGVSYQYGYNQLLAGAGYVPPVLVAILLFANAMKKKAYSIGSLTIPEYAGQLHDSTTVHFLCALLNVLLMLVFLITQFRSMGYLMAPSLGISEKAAILIVGGTVIVYTLFGGLKAVAYTDVIQAIGMTIGAALCIFLIFQSTDLSKMSDALNKINPELVNPTTGAPFGVSPWSPLLIMPYALIGLMSTPYLAVRFISVKTDIKWHQMALMSLPIMITWEMLPFVGNYVRAFYPALKVADKAMPTFINSTFHPVLASLMSIFILMAIMSTADSALHNVSGSLSYDLRKILYKKPLTSAQNVTLNRLGVLVAGFIGIFFTFYAPPFFLVFLGMLGLGTLHAAMFGPVFLSTFWRGNKWGAIASMVGGGTVCAWGLLSRRLGWAVAPVAGDIVAGLLYVGVSMLTFGVAPRPTTRTSTAAVSE